MNNRKPITIDDDLLSMAQGILVDSVLHPAGYYMTLPEPIPLAKIISERGVFDGKLIRYLIDGVVQRTGHPQLDAGRREDIVSRFWRRDRGHLTVARIEEAILDSKVCREVKIQVMPGRYETVPGIGYVYTDATSCHPPIVTDTVRRAVTALETATQPGPYFGGCHRAPCGRRSTSADYLLTNGYATCSLLPHYLACHADEIPDDEMERIETALVDFEPCAMPGVDRWV